MGQNLVGSTPATRVGIYINSVRSIRRMSRTLDDEIDALASEIELVIKQNDEVLGEVELDSDETSQISNHKLRRGEVDAAELFS